MIEQTIIDSEFEAWFAKEYPSFNSMLDDDIVKTSKDFAYVGYKAAIERQRSNGDKNLYEFVKCSACSGYGCMKCKSMGGFYEATAPQHSPIQGWQLVPIEPTEEMIEGFWGEIQHGEDEIKAAKEAYELMLSAAPSAPIEEESGYTPNSFFNWLDAYCLGMVVTQQSLRDEYANMLACPDSAPIEAQQSANSVLVDRGALTMVIQALRRDAAQGQVIRGEMADALIPSTQAPKEVK